MILLRQHYCLHALEHIHRRPTIPRDLGVLAPIRTKQDRILARTPQTRIVQPRRLPVVDTPTQSIRHGLHHIDDIVHPLRLSRHRDRHTRLTELRRSRPTALIRPVRLHYLQRLAVGLGKRIERRLQVRERSSGAVERIERKAKDIPVRRLDFPRSSNGAEPALLDRQVIAVVDVNHDLRGRHTGVHGVADAVAGAGPEGREVREVGDARGSGLDVNACFAVGPEHALADFVAEADDGEVDAGFVEGLEGAGDVLAEGGGQGGYVGRPFFGGGLFVWVGLRIVSRAI